MPPPPILATLPPYVKEIGAVHEKTISLAHSQVELFLKMNVAMEMNVAMKMNMASTSLDLAASLVLDLSYFYTSPSPRSTPRKCCKEGNGVAYNMSDMDAS